MKSLNTYLARHAQNCIGALGVLSQQPLASVLTIAVIGVALSLPAGLNLVVSNGQAAAGGWENIRDFSIYLHPDQPLASAEKLKDELTQTGLIEAVRIISATQALEEFQDDPGFGDFVAALEENPLPNTLVVRPKVDAGAEALSQLATDLRTRTEIDIVKLDTDWVARLDAFLELMRRGVWIASILLVGAVIVIIGNTIRLDIQNRRDEIEVSKLLGASDSFVRRPFLYTGFWYGLCGSLFALLLLLVTTWLIAGPVERLIALYGSSFSPTGLDGTTSLAVLAGGLLAGLGGAWSAVARHLSIIQPKV